MKEFGTLEYVLDTYSKNWTWKLTGPRAVSMVARVIPHAWYGNGPEEAIVPDTVQNVEKIKWIMDRYPLEIRSKSIWHRKVRKVIVPQKKWTRIEKLRKATPGPQFRGNLLDFQREGLDFLLKSYGNALLADEMGLGKCLKGDTLINTTNGSTTIKEIWEQSEITERDENEEWAKLKIPVSIQTFDGKNIVTKQVSRVFRQKINEPITKIILKDGSEIECTKRHRFLTPDGWKRAGELDVNDKVAVPAKTIHDGKNPISKDIAELMAWQIAEGYEYVENNRYPHGRFYNSDSKILDRVQKLAKQQGIDLPKARKEKTTHVIATTQFYQLFSKYGYKWGNRSKDKKVPRAIIEAPLEVQKAFVQAMFDSEGHVGKTHCEITIASKSIALALGEIFRHFGIWLRIRTAKKYATNGTKIRRTYYTCTFGGNSIERFVTQFQLLSSHKQIALEKLASKKHNTNIEGVPSQKIVQKIAESGVSLRSLNLYTSYKYTQGMSKQLALYVSDKLEASHHDLAQQLREISLESINWCQIKSVEEKLFCGHVYDLSVPETHNYIANGIITHNTVQTLAYLATEKQTFPVLIVAPLVTLNNWQRETQKFLKKRSRNGKISENDYPSSVLIRTGKAQEIGKYDVYIINYDLLHKRIDDLSKLNIKTIVCDEVQHLRSKTTKKYTAVKKLAALDSVKYRVGLSGTPIYNRGSEIWPIVDILRPGLLGTFDEFCEYFCYVNEKGKAIVLENKRASLGEELRKHVMLRRKKSDVLKELKDKVRYKELIDSDINYYQTELGKIWERLETEQKNATSAFDKFSSYKRAIQSERQAAGVAKVPHVIEFVKNIMEIEESVVVFCHHKAIHELLHRSLSEYTPASIIGGQSDKERQEGIDRFQNGETKLIIAGLRAGNVGINLSRARYVIFAELDWSPAIHRQAEDRLHRIGQKNTVFAYYLMGNGTLDDHVANVLVDKSYEIDAIMDEKAETFENKEKAEMILAQIHDKLTHSMGR
jgi:SNF2 family DNA or RNA helicase